MAPIVKIGRKLSRREKTEDDREEECVYDFNHQEVINTDLNIPADFISQMREAFSLFDKVEPD